MTCAPASAASWARCSCFWIIDSLSPVQLAWTSALRTVRGIAASTSDDAGTVTKGRRVHRKGIAGRPSPRPSAGRRRLVRGRLGSLAHVPLGELAAPPAVVEAADED